MSALPVLAGITLIFFGFFITDLYHAHDKGPGHKEQKLTVVSMYQDPNRPLFVGRRKRVLGVRRYVYERVAPVSAEDGGRE